MKKYELTTTKKVEFGITLFQIKALVNFSDVKKGDLDGFINYLKNANQETTK